MYQSFIQMPFINGILYDDSASKFPTKVHALVGGGEVFQLHPGSTYYIYQHTGGVMLNDIYPLLPGYYAVVAHAEDSENIIVALSADDLLHLSLPSDEGDEGEEPAICRTLIIERINGEKSTAPFQLGGPIEKIGRLRYIDGCTDSLLIAPWYMGEPCLNHLHFPPGINQTPHTHPSIRVGMVANGKGECITPWGHYPLQPDSVFVILPGDDTEYAEVPERETDGTAYRAPKGTHSFRTADTHMNVIAFHPDSDFGPRDEDHPMINRTIVNGQSANTIDEIRTK